MPKKPRPTKNYDHGKLYEKIRQSFPLQQVNPLTKNQEKVFQSFHRHNLFLHGSAGTGKTYLAIYLALNEILYGSSGKYDRLVLMKSAVPTRDLGFLPGDEKEKTAVYVAPYKAVLEELTGYSNAYDQMEQQKIIQFEPTSFLRGRTINNAIIVVDEVQNMTGSELHAVFTRIGKCSKVIFAGDMKQDDLKMRRERSGLNDFMTIIKTMSEFKFVEFTQEDIVRSELVRNYIIARENLETAGVIQPL